MDIKVGRQAIAECNRLGIVVDVAHATMAFVEAAAKVRNCRINQVDIERRRHAANAGVPRGPQRPDRQVRPDRRLPVDRPQG